MNRILALLSVIIFLESKGQGTNYIQNITPHTPETNAILKSFETPVSLYTGSADISVPLYNIQEGNISFPLKLSYNSTGITVGERASWVGLGWNLSTPTLVRNVRQLPDDFSYGFFYETKYTVNNVYNIKKDITPNTLPTNNDCAQCGEIDNLYKSKLLDLESDDYRLTLPDGKSISFMVNQERDTEHPIGHIVQFPDSDYKISYVVSSGNWEITNPQGYKYLYVKGNNINYSDIYTVGGNNSGTLPEKRDQPYTSSWVLSKITSSTNSILNFEYDSILYEDCDLINQTKTVENSTDGTGDPRNMVYTNYAKTKGSNFYISRIWGDFGEVVFNKDLRLDYSVYGRKLSNIEIKNKAGLVNKIVFEYDYMTSPSPPSKYTCNRFEDDNNISKRLLLKNVSFNSNTTSPLSYGFKYNDLILPNRFSYARDWWGYYNGEDSNPGLTPSIDVVLVEENKRNVNPLYAKAGILEEIIYPTGGKTKFQFESNRGIFYNYNTLAQQKIHDIIPYKIKYNFFSTHEDDTQLLNKTYEIPLALNTNELTSEAMQNIAVSTTTSKCIYPENSLPYINSCSIYYSLVDNSNNIILGRSLLQNGYSRTLSIERNKLLNGVKVKMEVYAGRVRPETQYFNYLQDEATVNLDYRVIDTASVRNTPYGIEVPLGGLRAKRIENYENLQNPIIKEYDYKNNDVETGISLIELDFLQTTPGKLFVTSQSRFPMQTGNGSLISYIYAAEHRINPFTSQRNSITNNYQNNYLLGSYTGSCFFNSGWGDALLSASVPCYEDPRNGKILFSDYAGKKTDYFEYQDVMTAGKNLNWVYGLDYDRVIKPADFTYIGLGANSPTYLGVKYFYYKFKNFDEPDYSKETKDIFNGNQVITKTDYKSLYPTHHQLTNEKVNHPDGTMSETSYSYAHEKNNQLLISKNMIGIPLETTTTQTMGTVTKTLGKTETIYPSSLPTSQAGNLVLPLSSVSYDVLNNASTTEVTYDKYDEKGNLLQYTGKDGIPVSIIWGYNNTQPIAKVEGITYNDLTAAVSIAGIVTASDNDAADPTKEGLLLDALNTFRKEDSLSGKLISTYTYDPLIGVTSITPPSGVRQTYSYDAANRLKEGNLRGKNNTGNYINKKVSENNYNYKP